MDELCNLRASELKVRAKAALQTNDYPAAIRLYTQAIDLDATSVSLYSNRSSAFVHLRLHEKALNDAEQILHLAPTWQQGYFRKGLSLYYLGRFHEAAQAYLEGMKYDPQNAQLRKGFDDAMGALKVRRFNQPSSSPSADSRAIGVDAQRPVIVNMHDGEVISYDLALLVGTCDSSAETIRITHAVPSAPRDPVTTEWPVTNGRFKVLVSLEAGTNQMLLTAADRATRFSIVYELPVTRRLVRFVYVLPSDNDGSFADLEDHAHTVEEALARIRLASRLIQVFTAEMLARHGFPRFTFHVASDVPIAKMTINTAAATQLTAAGLFTEAKAAIGKLPRVEDEEEGITIALLSVTGNVDEKARLHNDADGEWSLQKGPLALHPARAMFAWADELTEVANKFLDPNPVSEVRGVKGKHIGGVMWTCYSLMLGAMLNSIGSALRLDGGSNSLNVMRNYGYEHFNRCFMLSEMQSAKTIMTSNLLDENLVGWARTSAVQLRYSPYLLHYPGGERESKPTIDVSDGELVVTCATGIRLIMYRLVNGDTIHDEQLNELVTHYRVQLSDLRARCGDSDVRSFALIDNQGKLSESDAVNLFQKLESQQGAAAATTTTASVQSAGAPHHRMSLALR
eukprot:TRINITY_DN806_c0_g1_i1.p1 TRINITY_DN806_c0_g1~~TRINITY_DN806_c0_g1_i1.p1  ORF type:complete len:650 (+),score=136.30 TRINITY_DN806_c0_g1_i1:74-1951(+)